MSFQRQKIISIWSSITGAALLLSACTTTTRYTSADRRIEPSPASPPAAVAAPVSPPLREPKDYTLLIDDIQGLALFPEERPVVQKLVASWARARGFRIAELEQTERVFERARAGRHVQTGVGEDKSLPLE